jgi:Bacterial Ig-like domain (group 2)
MRLLLPARASGVFGAFVCCAALWGCGGGSMAPKQSVPPELTKIVVTPASKSIAKGTSLQLTATGTYSDETQEDITSAVTWQTSPTSVAKVDAKGAVIAMDEGVAQVSAVYQKLTGNASITVGPAALVSIAVGLQKSSLPLGESETLTATGTFTDGTIQDLTQSAAWKVSPAKVATITAKGSFTAVAEGVAQISADSQGITGSTSITVTPPALLHIAVSSRQSPLPLGASVALTATGSFSDGSTKDLTQAATWKVSPSSIAKIDPHGSLTGVGQGVAQVSAAYQGMTGDASITVGPPALVQILVSPSQLSLPLGESEPLTATGSFTDGSSKNMTQSVTWISSGPSIAGVSSKGAVSAKSTGSTTISARSGIVTGSAGLTVTAAVAVSLTITPASSSLLIGNSGQLQAIETFSDGTTRNQTTSATWSSATPNVVYVSTVGVVTGAQVGSGTVRAKSGSFSASAALTVMPLMTVSYFNRANAVSSGYDGTIRLINPGETTGYTAGDNLCAMIYVFDRNQELNECCGCKVSDSGLRTISLTNGLTSNPLTGKPPVAGTIEIVPSEVGADGQCNAGSITPNGMILGWETNVQGSTGKFQVTEIPMTEVPLAYTQAQVLAAECSMMQKLGSGAGVCSCGSGDQ